MKIKGDYLLDTIGGEKMAVPITVNDGGLAGLIRLNEVGAFLWEKLQGGSFWKNFAQRDCWRSRKW